MSSSGAWKAGHGALGAFDQIDLDDGRAISGVSEMNLEDEGVVLGLLDTVARGAFGFRLDDGERESG